MIISPSRQFIFAHIPKTGGTSFARAYEDHALSDDVLIGDTPLAKRRRKFQTELKGNGRLWKHSTLADIEGVVTRDQMAAMYVVTMVRNPWDRLVSYYFWLRGQNFAHPAVQLSKALSFSAFLNHPHTIQSLVQNPYAQYVVDGAGYNHVDLYIRVEHWENDMVPLWDRIGLRFDLGVFNASARNRNWRPYYSDADSRLISRLCLKDITQHGYVFDQHD